MPFGFRISSPHTRPSKREGPDLTFKESQLPRQPDNRPHARIPGSIPRFPAAQGPTQPRDNGGDDGDDQPDKRPRATQPTVTPDESPSTVPAQDRPQPNAVTDAPTPVPTAATGGEPTSPTTGLNHIMEAYEELGLKRKKPKVSDYVAIWLWVVKGKKSLRGCRPEALGWMAGQKRRRDGMEWSHFNEL